MLTESTYGFSRPRPLYQAGAPVSLAGIVASTVFDLDATVVASYPGSGSTWANLVAAPADGSAQTAYNFTITGWTFNGSAGNAAAYFSSDGAGDFAQMAANTAFTRDMGKTTGGSDFWAAITFQHGATGVFWGNHNAATTVGLSTRLNANQAQVTQRQSSTAATSSAITLSAGTNYLLIVSHSHTSHQTKFWVNTATAETDSHAFNTGTTDPVGVFTIGAQANAGIPLSSGTRIYSVALGNEYLNDAKAASIMTYLNARHGRVYA